MLRAFRIGSTTDNVVVLPKLDLSMGDSARRDCSKDEVWVQNSISQIKSEIRRT